MLLVTIAMLSDENKRDIVAMINKNLRSDNSVTMIVSQICQFP